MTALNCLWQARESLRLLHQSPIDSRRDRRRGKQESRWLDNRGGASSLLTWQHQQRSSPCCYRPGLQIARQSRRCYGFSITRMLLGGKLDSMLCTAGCNVVDAVAGTWGVKNTDQSPLGSIWPVEWSAVPNHFSVEAS